VTLGDVSASHVLDPVPGIQAGASVELHPEGSFPGGTATPIGAVLATAVTAANGKTTFTGLAYDRDYWAYDPASGRRVRFRTDPDPNRPELTPIAVRLGVVETRAWSCPATPTASRTARGAASVWFHVPDDLAQRVHGRADRYVERRASWHACRRERCPPRECGSICAR
jgi:hypothetical protein